MSRPAMCSLHVRYHGARAGRLCELSLRASARFYRRQNAYLAAGPLETLDRKPHLEAAALAERLHMLLKAEVAA